jgi:GTPase SAR1 family protein
MFIFLRAFDIKFHKSGHALQKLNIIFIGDSKVGKSSLINSYINNNFQQAYNPTTEFM